MFAGEVLDVEMLVYPVEFLRFCLVNVDSCCFFCFSH